MAEELIPLPSHAKPLRELSAEADDPRLDELIGETLAVRGLEWIGEREPYKGVRFYVHRVHEGGMEKNWFRARGYTVGVMRLARDLAGDSKERTVKLEQWPIVKVIRQGAHYGLESA